MSTIAHSSSLSLFSTHTTITTIPRTQRQHPRKSNRAHSRVLSFISANKPLHARTTTPENEHPCSFSGAVDRFHPHRHRHTTNTATTPENEQDCSFLGFVILFGQPPPSSTTPENEQSCSFSRAVDLFCPHHHHVLSTPYHEHNDNARERAIVLVLGHCRSFPPTSPPCKNHNPRKQATVLVFRRCGSFGTTTFNVSQGTGM